MVVAQQTNCPMCHSQMNPNLVVCRPCYRTTDRLQPGAHKVPMILTARTIDLWSQARDERITKEGSS